MGSCEEDRRLHASVLKREAWKEERFREEQQKRDAEFKLGFGATEMCKEELRKVIDSDRRVYYRTEDLNDKLYIHYKGWRTIQGLEGWTGLKALYAECNAFSKIQGLSTCRMLRSLFLQENCIHKIEGLENCVNLWNINLNNNFIERIEGLENLTNLNTLTISKNRLGHGGVEDIIKLADSPITSLDIQDNLIWDPDVLPEVFMRMTNLRVLYLKGNPCAKKIPNYRKNITVCCFDLRYLDDRPVFPDDRRAADAFNRGGIEEERAERRRIRDEEREKHDRNLKAFGEMIEQARAEKREREAMRAEDKYTEENDPVESSERRMKRLHDQWREDNADNLKDDAREYAEKCLKAEREMENNATQMEAAKADGAVEMEADPLKGYSAAGGHEPKPEDNRKLVYEDIWDDIPPLKGSQANSQTQSFATPEPAPTVDVPKATVESFKPFDMNDNLDDMDAMLPANSIKQVKVESEVKPNWYDKYAEKAKVSREHAIGLSANGNREGDCKITVVDDLHGVPETREHADPPKSVPDDGELQEMD